MSPPHKQKNCQILDLQEPFCPLPLLSLSGVIIEDYNKGLLTEPFIHEILKIAKEAGLKVLVDPKFDNFFAYEVVTLFKPNLRELAEATSMKVSNIEEIRRAAQDLKKRLKCENVMVTMGKDGVGLLDSSENFINHGGKAFEVLILNLT